MCMKKDTLLAMFLFICGIFSVNAQDLIVLRNGTIIEAKVIELSPTEIRYKRFSHPDGPTIIVPVRDVLSIRYENGTVENFNAVSASGQASSQANTFQEGNTTPQLKQPTALQNILNVLPAIPIAGNNLKFEFGGESWVARVNGENFSAGNIEFEETAEGGILTLRQTHIWPGAVGKTAGRVASMVPGGGAVGGVLNTAGNVAGTLGPIEASGTIVIEYKAGPPASLRLVSSSGSSSPADIPETKAANARNNWMSYELAFVGIGVRYERMLSSKISLGANIYGNPFFPFAGKYFDINSFFRVYPWGKTFFLGAGLGYYHYFDYGFPGDPNIDGFSIIPEIGWKIDVGKAGGFYIMPCITWPMVISKMGFTPGFRVIYFGMGHAF